MTSANVSVKRLAGACLFAIAAGATIAAFGDTYTVNEGETQTYDSITNTTRFTKNGTHILIR